MLYLLFDMPIVLSVGGPKGIKVMKSRFIFSPMIVTTIILTLSVLFFTFEVSPALSLLLSMAIMIGLYLQIQNLENEKALIQKELVALGNADILNKASLEAKDRELQEKYFIDDLTKLPNRNALVDTLKIDNAHTLILLNIDSFKEINEFYGYKAGDSLIKQLAIKLPEIPFRFSHSLYHIHIDEFALLIHEKLTISESKALVLEIENFIQQHTFYASMNQSILFTLSFGISHSRDQTPINSLLITQASLALSCAKRHIHSWLIYEDSLNKHNAYEENLYWLKKLQLAIQEDRIEPYFQPIINNKTQKVSSQEALMRLMEKNGAAISPYLFLDIAKKAKLYTTLTTIMIEKTFARFEKSKMHFSINFSYEDMIDKEVLELLVSKLKNGDIGKRFTAEILESESISNYDLVKNFIDTIKVYNAKVAIDDFGSGYSNFERLFKLDIDYIKIDGSIIKDIDENAQLRIITETIVTFAKKTNIKVIAEFVHSKEIVDILEDMGVKRMQGFYFAQPSAEPMCEIQQEEIVA